MKILVTGANGYIGRHAVKALLEKGHTVIAVGRQLDQVDARATKIHADIFNLPEDPFNTWHQPDALLHLAWQDGFIHNASSHIEGLPKHLRFVQSLVDAGLQQLIVMGSMHEVGFYEGQINEETPCRPTSFYGIAKNSLRQALDVYLKDKAVSFQWLRAFYVVGDDASNHSIFTKILEKECQGEASFPFTDGQAQYDFIRIKDLAQQIATVAEQKGVTGIIHCCSGTPVRIKDAVEAFLSEHQLNIKPAYGTFPTRPYDSKIIYGDNAKIKRLMEQAHAE